MLRNYKKKKAQKSAKKAPPVNPLTEIVNKKYPDKPTFRKKILPLWGNFFRVNYHDSFNSNLIKYSHFCRVTETSEICEY